MSGRKVIVRYRSAGGVVIDTIGRVLLIERTLDDRYEVRLPKGHIDAGETPEAAAVREVCEETGYCDLRVLADLGWRQVTFERADGRRVVRDECYYLMRLVSDHQRPPQFTSEREALFCNRWVADLEEAERVLTFEAERNAVQRARAALEQLASRSR